MPETKRPWQSKTLWLNLILAALAVAYPPANEWVQSHPEIVMAAFAGINVLLRLISHDRISLSE